MLGGYDVILIPFGVILGLCSLAFYFVAQFNVDAICRPGAKRTCSTVVFHPEHPTRRGRMARSISLACLVLFIGIWALGLLTKVVRI